jgi:hypothetical protein
MAHLSEVHEGVATPERRPLANIGVSVYVGALARTGATAPQNKGKATVKKTSLLAVMAIVAVVSITAITPAGAAPAAKSQAQVLGTVVTHDDGTASVKARYICPEGFHLWVSAKQSEDGTPDRRLRLEGSSQFAAAWLQSHPSPASFTCDGQWHTGTFEIDTAEQGWGELKHGQAWVQFCLIGEATFISESRWVAVR